MTLLDYIFFRFYDYFKRKKDYYAMTNTLMIVYIIELSLFLFTYYFISLFVELNFIKNILQENRSNKILIATILTIVIFFLNYIYFSPKRKKDYYLGLEKKYLKDKYKLPMWIMFSFPIFILLISIIGYGLIKGTLRSPLLDSLF